MNPAPGSRPNRRPSRRTVLGTVAGLAAAGVVGGFAWNRFDGGDNDGTSSRTPAGRGKPIFERLSGPDRTLVRAADGTMLATFTDGARTVVLTGPSRRFSEPRTTSAVVETTAWVRLLPTAWQHGREDTHWFKQWFPKALADRSPDLFTIAFEYSSAGAPDKHTKSGVRYAGRAHFGPRVPGVDSPLEFHYHDEKSDFYDYLGIPWTFPDGTRRQPEKARYGDVDCSGFQRLVWGYRMGFPLHETNAPGPGLPRRAFAIAAYGPGVTVIPDTKQRPTDVSPLQPGDLLFFSIAIGRPHDIDHCGFYLGLDNGGHPRFYSSRSAADGPTMGDLAGAAILDGNGFYARGFRSARRL